MTKLQLTKDKFTIIDEDMLPFLRQWHWTFDGRYACRTVRENDKRTKIYLHKLINQTPTGKDTDHINGDKLDNRRENLRSATRGQNCVNQGKYKNKTSRYKGVCWHKQRRKWKAEIKRGGVKKHLGLFVSEKDAARAYDKAVQEYFGNYAILNMEDSS